jgi:SNF2 family DNA or RNA helicase
VVGLAIFIEVNQAENSYLLKGEIAKFSSIPRVRLSLVKLNAIFNNEKIEIPFTVDSKEIVLGTIRQLVDRFGFEENVSDDLKIDLSQYYLEEQKFKDFAEQAYIIRNNQSTVNALDSFAEVISKEMPNRTLYKLQLLSAYHLAFAQNASNFSVPGAGKTSIVYAAFSYLKSLEKTNPKNVDKLLIIGPLSSFGPWEKEYQECFGKKPDIKRISGELKKGLKENYFYSFETCEVNLMSYPSVINLKNEIVAFLKNNRVMVVLDEAHKIKNTNGGKIASSILAISPFCSSRVVLTGTPAQNGFEDLINIYDFLWPKKNIVGFNKQQLSHMSKSYDVNNPARDSRVKKLVDNISPFFLRIRKSDLGIPEPINHPLVRVKMGEQQRIIYDFIEQKFIESIEKEKTNSVVKEALSKSKMIRLMQAATNPNLLKKPLEEYYLANGYIEDSTQLGNQIAELIELYSKSEIPPKFIKTLELIKKILTNGQKVVVWAIFIQNMIELQNFLNINGVKSKLLYGATPVEQNDELNFDTREKIVEEFNDVSSDLKVVIANPFAVAESISLHKACHNAIYLERTFNVAQFVQSKDRIHRYGLKQTDIINYYFLASEDSIDETLDMRLSMKEKRMNNLLENEEIPLFSIVSEDVGNDDMKAVLADYARRNSAK